MGQAEGAFQLTGGPMKTDEKTKVFFWGVWFLPGMLLSFFNFFGPVHEIGHMLAALFTYAEVVNISWNEVSIRDPGWAVVYAGYVFEMTFFLILTLILRLRKLPLSFLSWGSCHGCFLMAFVGSDFGLTSGLARGTITVSVLLWTSLFLIITGFVWPKMREVIIDYIRGVYPQVADVK